MILIVDDKSENIFALKRLLELNNFEVDTALSGEDALKKVLKNNYKLIILDVQMPGMDGFEVAEAISGLSKSKDTPIIFLSAVSTDKKFIAKGYSSGGIDYIAKPVDPDILLLKVKTFYHIYEQSRALKKIQSELRHEIDARKKAQFEQNRKTLELQSILESIPQIAFMANASGDIEYVNEQWYIYSDHKNAFPEIYDGDIAVSGFWQKTMIDHTSLSVEVCIRKLCDNVHRFHLLNLIPVKEDREIIKWVGTFTDIHEQKLSKDFLEKRVEERTSELIIANKELAFRNKEKGNRAAELDIANKELLFQNEEKEKRADELIVANLQLATQSKEKEKRADELIIVNLQLATQSKEKERRAAELIIANKELAFQNYEKERRASELITANKELAFQNNEKENRAAELIVANKELAFQNNEKENRASELVIANKELAFQNDEKEKRAAELIIANKELAFQNDEKENRAAELIIANKELAFQNDEKENRAAELIIANRELAFQNDEKEKRAAELNIANRELAFQNEEKEKRAAELVVANKELVFQNKEKEKRAAELIIANKELVFQNDEKEKRAAELIIANKELVFQNDEKEKRAAELKQADEERTKMTADIVQRNKNLEQFSYIISHNLRAPVANILGLTNILQAIENDTAEGKKITGYLDTAAKNLDKVIRDINEILAMKHDVNERKQSIVFSSLLDEIMSGMQNNINEVPVHIISDFSQAEGMLTIKSYLYSIFSNLISNSIKYRQRFIKPVIEISSVRLKNKIQLIFKDNGLGIDIKKNGRDVFGLYKRFHNHVEGKGMGLYMVKAQLETLGGAIFVESEVNKGTEFRIEFDDK
jgi:DNA-binding response OmpR family regulator/signal transduction histidine kinase